LIEFFHEFDCLESDMVTLKIVEKNKGATDMLPFYYYDIFNKAGEHVGKISVRIGNNFHSYYNGHIGYEIFEGHRGKHYSYEAVKLVLQVAKAHGMKELFITCGLSNDASIKTIERLGAVKKDIVKIPKECFFYHEGIQDYCVYSLQIN